MNTRITLLVGGARLSIDAALIKRLVLTNVPPSLVNPDAAAEPKDKAIRFALKAFLRMLLPWVETKIKQSGAALPLPTPPPGADLIAFALDWITNVMLLAATAAEWDATYEEQASGEILVTGVAPAAARLVDGSVGLPEPQPVG